MNQILTAIFIIASMSEIDFSNFASRGSAAIGTIPDPLIPLILQDLTVLNKPSRSSFDFNKVVIRTFDFLIICATINLKHMYLNKEDYGANIFNSLKSLLTHSQLTTRKV